MTNKLNLIALLGLFFMTCPGILLGQGWNLLEKVEASDHGHTDHFSFATTISGNYAAIGAYRDDEDEEGEDYTLDAGSVYIFELNQFGQWVETQKIVPSDRTGSDFFGHAVSMSGDYLVVGAHQDGHDENGSDFIVVAGSAYIFKRNESGVWEEIQKIVASDRTTQDIFGRAVSISGNYIVIGAPNEKDDENGLNEYPNAGSCYIFENDGNDVWTEVQKIVPEDRGPTDYFGYAVAISNDQLLVGAYRDDDDLNAANQIDDAGSAYIFERNGDGDWLQQSKITPAERNELDNFGSSVTIENGIAIVGAFANNFDVLGQNNAGNAGAAFVFERTEMGEWPEVQKLVASDRTFADHFGWSVSLSGNNVLIGAESDSNTDTNSNPETSAGSAYLFHREEGGVWVESQKIWAYDRDVDDSFGYAIGLSGEHAVVGAYGYDNTDQAIQYTSGAAYFFGFCEPTSSSISVSACESYTSPSGVLYDTSGEYIDVIDNANNCDSVITIDLTITNSAFSEVELNVCDSVEISGDWYFQSQTVEEFFPNGAANGCDSTRVTNLEITNSIMSSDIVQICQGGQISIHGQMQSEPGEYTQSFSGANTCDSISTIYLEFFPEASSVSNISGCDSLEYAGVWYFESATLNLNYPGASIHGCDSTAEVNINLGTTLYGTENLFGCDDVFFNGQFYYESTQVQQTFSGQGLDGCDSISIVDIEVVQINNSIGFDFFTLSNPNVSGVSYQWVSCGLGFPEIAGETGPEFTPTVTGIYAFVATDGECSEMSDCVPVIVLGLEEALIEQISIAPNPMVNGFKISIPQELTSVNLQIFDITGRKITTQTGIQNLEFISMDVPSGVYFVNILTDRGATKVFRMVKS